MHLRLPLKCVLDPIYQCASFHVLVCMRMCRASMVDTQDNHGTTTAAAGAEEPADDRAQEVPEPSFRQLLRVGVTKGLPFVAFGFFDNIIMVGGWVAGW